MWDGWIDLVSQGAIVALDISRFIRGTAEAVGGVVVVEGLVWLIR